MARPGYSFRASRRNRARRQKLVWRSQVRAQFNGATYIPIALEKASNATGITGEFVQYGTGTYPEGDPRNEAGLAESFRQTKEAGDGEDAAA